MAPGCWTLALGSDFGRSYLFFLQSLWERPPPDIEISLKVSQEIKNKYPMIQLLCYKVYTQRNLCDYGGIYTITCPAASLTGTWSWTQHRWLSACEWMGATHICMHVEFCAAIKKNEISARARTSVGLEVVISKVIFPQKDKFTQSFLYVPLDFKIFENTFFIYV